MYLHLNIAINVSMLNKGIKYVITRCHMSITNIFHCIIANHSNNKCHLAAENTAFYIKVCNINLSTDSITEEIAT